MYFTNFSNARGIVMKKLRIKNDNRILIGSNIRQIREQRNLKPKDLVLQVQLRGVDINSSALSKIEANKQHIRAEQLKAIAEILKVNCIDLLAERTDIDISTLDD